MTHSITTTANNDPTITHLPLNQLVKSPYNVRRQKPTGIDELADNIDATGLAHNLVVHAMKGKRGKPQYGVAAGQRRLLALIRLHESGRLPEGYTVPVKVIGEEEARLLSFSENAHREAMHPADQIEAFAALVDKGHSVDYIASVFGITPLTVQRRLKLASMSPPLLAQLREDGITLEQLAVLALIDDPAAQEALWFSLKDHERAPHALRRLITVNEVDVKNNKLAKFVGVAAYEAAGGGIRRDMFADEDDGGTLTDAALLQRLAQDKMTEAVEAIRAEGWKWVEYTLEGSTYELTAKCKRLPPDQFQLNDEAQQVLAALEQRLTTLVELLEVAEAEGREDDDTWQAMAVEHDALDEQIDAMREAAAGWTAATKAQAGAVVSLTWEGGLNIQRGYQRTADQPATAKAAKPIHSEKLARRLNAHLSSAIQATLAAQADKALILLAHALICQTFDGHGRHGLAEGLCLSHDDRCERLPQHAPELEHSPDWQSMASARMAWQERLPDDFSTRIDWLAAWPQEDTLAILAYCVAASYENPFLFGKNDPDLPTLQAFLGLDMRQHWQPTRESYLNHVNKARLLDIAAREVGQNAADRLAILKKADAAATLEEMLTDSGWLPPGLSTAPLAQAAH